LLKEAVPGISRVAVLSDPTIPTHALDLREAEVAARSLKVQLQVLLGRLALELDLPIAVGGGHGLVDELVVVGVRVGSRVVPQSVAFLTRAGHVSSWNSTLMFSLVSSAWSSSNMARLSTSPFCDWKRKVKPPG
jgi:hypothetical protein